MRASLLYNNNGNWLPQTHSTHYKNTPEPGSGVTFSWVPFSLTWVSWLWIAVSAKKPNPRYSPVKSAHPVHSCPSLPFPPSLPQCRLGREERAETPHWPRWLAANQLQPKVIGSRWETFWWREQGEQVASWKEEEKKRAQSPRGMKERQQSVSCSSQLGEPFLSVNTLNWVWRNELKRALMFLLFHFKQQWEGTVKGELA